MTALYEELGLSSDATYDEIKAAYRAKAKALHPDGGGSTEQFQAVSQAYRVLADPRRRQTYDRTGRVDDKPDNLVASAMELIRVTLGSVAADERAIYRDVAAELRRAVAATLDGLRNNRRRTERQVAKTESFRRRFSAKRGPDIVGQMLEADIAAARASLDGVDQQIRTAEYALELLADTAFEVEAPPPPPESFYRIST